MRAAERQNQPRSFDESC